MYIVQLRPMDREIADCIRPCRIDWMEGWTDDKRQESLDACSDL